MNHIYLIGFMGSGKTTVGKELAKKLNRTLIDMDRTIEESESRSVQAIFDESGEAAFRSLETILLKEIANKEFCVVSTGGGAVLAEENRQVMQGSGKVIFLHATDQQIIHFLENDKRRPLLQGDDYEEKIKNMLIDREPIYMSTADIIIQTTGKNIQEIVQEIVSML